MTWDFAAEPAGYDVVTDPLRGISGPAQNCGVRYCRVQRTPKRLVCLV
jgi:hypothetical protein